MEQNKKQGTKICEVCGDIDSAGTSSYVSCLECEQVMCKKCGGLHQKMKSSRHHTLLANPSSTTPNPHAIDEMGVCVRHRGRKMDLFCTTCLIPVCQECSLQGHPNHRCLLVQDVGNNLRGEISSRLCSAITLSAEDTEVIAMIDNVEQSVKHLNNGINADFTRCTEKWKNELKWKKGEFIHLQTQLGQLRHRTECHVENLQEIQTRAKEALAHSGQYSIASSYKELRDSFNHLLCKTSDRSGIVAISKTVSQLQLQQNHPTCFGSLVFASRERRNIGVNTVNGPSAVTFTRDGRLAIFGEFIGPADSKNELSYYTHSYGGKERTQIIWKTCRYYAIKQTDTTYRVAEKFGIEIRLNICGSRTLAFTSLSDLRFVGIRPDHYYGSSVTHLSFLNEDSTDIPCFIPSVKVLSDVVTDLEDNIYISCATANIICVVRPNGIMIKTIPTGNLQPKHIAVCPCSPDQILFTHDSSRVSVTDCNGKLLRTITRPEWKEVAIGCDNKDLFVLWKCARGLRTLQRFTTEGRLLDTLFESEKHSCYSLLLAVSPDGSAAVVTDEREEGTVTLISTTREVESYSMR